MEVEKIKIWREKEDLINLLLNHNNSPIFITPNISIRLVFHIDVFRIHFLWHCHNQFLTITSCACQLGLRGSRKPIPPEIELIICRNITTVRSSDSDNVNLDDAGINLYRVGPETGVCGTSSGRDCETERIRGFLDGNVGVWMERQLENFSENVREFSEFLWGGRRSDVPLL